MLSHIKGCGVPEGYIFIDVFNSVIRFLLLISFKVFVVPLVPSLSHRILLFGSAPESDSKQYSESPLFKIDLCCFSTHKETIYHYHLFIFLLHSWCEFPVSFKYKNSRRVLLPGVTLARSSGSGTVEEEHGRRRGGAGEAGGLWRP